MPLGLGRPLAAMWLRSRLSEAEREKLHWHTAARELPTDAERRGVVMFAGTALAPVGTAKEGRKEIQIQGDPVTQAGTKPMPAP